MSLVGNTAATFAASCVTGWPAQLRAFRTTSPSRVLARSIAILAVAVPVVLSSTSAHATNFQDLWWNPAESGWGVNIAQQADTLFATWFIYGPNREPYWVVMPGTTRLNSGPNVYRGDIFQTRGTPFATVPFVPITEVTNVGSATFSFADAKVGTLTYTINGQSVTKSISRQVIVPINPAGTYYGGLRRDSAGCSNNTNNGSRLDQSIYVVATVPPNNISITEVGSDGCRFAGTWTQYGSIFEASGNYACAGFSGAWVGTEGTLGESTLSLKLRLTRSDETCVITGGIGGFRPS